ncbi:protein FAM71E2-like [Pollicipes pollicipes]|uniref:protein FAM71E2-like n=1 Tax=Pollicipes pollicipes TaxID=41117 RepID=UPI001884D32E|nr:protein FAM71E2-like [Pollicipes pollicipes]
MLSGQASLSRGTPDHPATSGWRPVPGRESRRLPQKEPLVTPDPPHGATLGAPSSGEPAAAAPSKPAPSEPAPSDSSDAPSTRAFKKPTADRTLLPSNRWSPGGWRAKGRSRAPPPERMGVVIDPDSRQAWSGASDGSGGRALLSCQPTKKYRRLDGMTAWCLANCPIYCPRTHCVCSWEDGTSDWSRRL